MAPQLENLIPTRRSLLSRLKNLEDDLSWRDFFDTYWKLLYGVALHAGLNANEAEEVVQETVIAVSKKVQDFKYDPQLGSFKGWLLHITKWRINDQFRKRQAAQRFVKANPPLTTRTDPIEGIPDPKGADLDAIWDKEWREHIFEAALEKVKKTVNAMQYQMFDLYVVKQWSAEKVAQLLGVNPGRVFLAKHRILALVKKEVQKLDAQTF